MQRGSFEETLWKISQCQKYSNEIFWDNEKLFFPNEKKTPHEPKRACFLFANVDGRPEFFHLIEESSTKFLNIYKGRFFCP